MLRDAVARWGSHATAISSIPGRWGMIALADEDPAGALEKIADLHDSLIRSDLIG